MEYVESFNIENVKRRLLIKYPLFGTIIANTKLEEVMGLRKIETDGEIIYYDPQLLDKATDDERLFSLAHEICHIAFNHVFRSEGKKERLWNIAADAVTNQFLYSSGLSIPDGCVNIAEASNYDVEAFYDKLLKEEQQAPKQCNCSNETKDKPESENDGNQNNKEQNEDQGHDGEQQNKSQDEGPKNKGQNQDQNQEGQQQDSQSGSKEVDGQKSGGNDDESGQPENKELDNNDASYSNHCRWKDAVKRHNEDNKSSSVGENENKEQKSENSAKEQLKEAKDGITKMGEKESSKVNEQLRKKQLEKLLSDLSKESVGAGTTTNSVLRNTNNIGSSGPLINWEVLLQDSMNFETDWSYKHAEIEDGIVRPILEEYPIAETEILLDTSGTVDDNLLKNFLRECKSILKVSKVEVGCFDVRFYGFSEIKSSEDIDKFNYIGGGGTDFNVAVNAFTGRAENKIIFTDGKAPMPTKYIDAIWIVFGNKKINPPGGKVIYITDDQLKKLYFAIDDEQQNINKTR